MNQASLHVEASLRAGGPVEPCLFIGFPRARDPSSEVVGHPWLVALQEQNSHSFLEAKVFLS